MALSPRKAIFNMLFSVVARSPRTSTGVVDKEAAPVYKRNLTEEDADTWRRRFNQQGYSVVTVLIDRGRTI